MDRKPTKSNEGGQVKGPMTHFLQPEPTSWLLSLPYGDIKFSKPINVLILQGGQSPQEPNTSEEPRPLMMSVGTKLSFTAIYGWTQAVQNTLV